MKREIDSSGADEPTDVNETTYAETKLLAKILRNGGTWEEIRRTRLRKLRG